MSAGFFRAYVGQTRSNKMRALLVDGDIGECTQRGELNGLLRFPFFYDNGAFRDWKAGQPFNCVRWTRDLRRMRYRNFGKPDFVVVPDLIGGGLASLKFSAFWRDEAEGFRAYLVVQENMPPWAVAVALRAGKYHGIFVGGASRDWKDATSPTWVKLAHDLGLRCHIGRVGQPERVRWAKHIGADSIDSSFPLWNIDRLAEFVAAVNEG